MCDKLKNLSASQLEHLIKISINKYNGENYLYTVKDLNSPNVNSTDEKLTFKVEIKCNEATSH